MLASKALKDTLTDFRHHLHQFPELSGNEEQTAKKVLDFLQSTAPDKVFQNIGGCGVALVYDSRESGPVVMFRCELDALPIQETNALPYASATPGISHKCGHDGHMAILAGLGCLLTEEKINSGKVILLFQPAEETGEGALQVLQDPVWKEIQPDYLFALHNIPGLPKYQICSKPGTFAAASKGMTVTLQGATSHAAHPDQGKSPAAAMATIIHEWEQISNKLGVFQDFTLLTVVHALLGEVAFGVTPGYAELRATLRSFENIDMITLTRMAEEVVQQQAKRYDLSYTINYTEAFVSTVNDPEAYRHVQQAAEACQLDFQLMKTPFRWSEDFGYFSSHCKTALFGLGASKTQPVLHHTTYDFPDDLILTGSRMFLEIAKGILSREVKVKS